MNSSVTNLLSELKPSFDKGVAVESQNLTVSTSVVDLLATALNEYTTHVLWDVQDANVNVTFDGNDPQPAGAFGHQIQATANGVWTREFAEACKLIREDSTDAIVHITELQPR